MLRKYFNSNIVSFFIIGLFAYYNFIVIYFVIWDPTSIESDTL
jgi:type III secretory pathway component EscR